MSLAEATPGRSVLRGAAFALVALLIVAGAAWGAAALWFQGPDGSAARPAILAVWSCVAIAAVLRAWRRPAHGLAIGALALAGLTLWWSAIPARGDRDWAPELAVQFTGSIDPAHPGVVTLEGVRDFDWITRDQFVERWETRSYDLATLASVDVLLSYWSGPTIAHTMVSFGFEDGEQVAFSVEIRKERGEAYSEIGGFFKEFELSLIGADERDVVRLRSNVRGEDVRLYRVAMPPDMMRALFLAYVATANDLATRPRWYNTITANCTTLIYEMADRITPGLPLDWRLVLSGRLPQYLYDLGALDMRRTLPELEAQAAIAVNARAADADPEFSAAIRRGIPHLPAL